MNGVDRSPPRDMNGDMKLKREPGSTPNSDTSSHNGGSTSVSTTNGVHIKSAAIKEVSTE